MVVDTLAPEFKLLEAEIGEADSLMYTTSAAIDGDAIWTTYTADNVTNELNFIYGLKWVYTNVPVGDTLNSTDVTVEWFGLTVDDASIAPGDGYTNQVDLTATYGSEEDTETASSTVYLDDDYPCIQVTKTVDSARVEEEETVLYTIVVSNHAQATGDLVLTGADTLQIVDTLPAIFTISNISNDGDYDAGAHTITWDITETTLEPGESVTVTFNATVLDGTAVGSYSNSVVCRRFTISGY